MKKVGIATVHTGYNFGSALQAYATKIILNEIGYCGVLLALKGSLIRGRDVRIRKICGMMKRLLFNYNQFNKHIKAYKTSLSKEKTEEEKRMFDNFCKDYLKPCYTTLRKLKKEARSNDFCAFLAGSDQIWNSEAIYVDPFYYLRFAPEEKRIALAPSFGRASVADYNKKTISKYIKDFKRISVREKSAVKIVKELTDKDVECLLDPTLIVSKEKWKTELKVTEKESDYILAYFLDEPSEYAKKYIKNLAKEKGTKILSIAYAGKESAWFDERVNAGPEEFIKYLANARYVCTDSFHGTAFSLNFGIPFFTFKRQYGRAGDQSERIKSLLDLTNMELRYEPKSEMIHDTFDVNSYIDILERERQKAKKYLIEGLSLI